jgi:hypothetical protein
MLIQAIDSQDSSIELTLRQSLELAITQGAKAPELRAAIRLADLWICQGKRDQARNLLRPICDWFTEGHDTPDFQQAAEIRSLSTRLMVSPLASQGDCRPLDQSQVADHLCLASKCRSGAYLVGRVNA